jgi:hypothetical protein
LINGWGVFFFTTFFFFFLLLFCLWNEFLLSVVDWHVFFFGIHVFFFLFYEMFYIFVDIVLEVRATLNTSATVCSFFCSFEVSFSSQTRVRRRQVIDHFIQRGSSLI